MKSITSRSLRNSLHLSPSKEEVMQRLNPRAFKVRASAVAKALCRNRNFVLRTTFQQLRDFSAVTVLRRNLLKRLCTRRIKWNLVQGIRILHKHALHSYIADHKRRLELQTCLRENAPVERLFVVSVDHHGDKNEKGHQPKGESSSRVAPTMVVSAGMENLERKETDGDEATKEKSLLEFCNREHSKPSAELYEAIEDRKKAQQELLQAHDSIATVVRAILEQQRKGQQQQKQLSMALQKSLSIKRDRAGQESNSPKSNSLLEPNK